MPKKNKLILVTGATGHQGGAVLRHLRAQNFPVRALTRDPDQPAARALIQQSGVEVVRGDMDDPASLSRALDGVDGVFSVQDWQGGAESEIRHGINLAEAAARAVVSHFVYSSVCSADQNTGIPHFDSKSQVEERVRSLGIPFSILRPVFFMENFIGMRSSLEQGVLATPLKPETRLQMIAVDDIAAFATDAFEHPGKWNGRTLDIAGDEHSMSDTARLLSGAVGRDVNYQQVPWDQFEKQVGHETTVMFRWFEEVGYHIDIAALREQRPNMLTLEHWLQTHWEKATRAAQ